MSYRVRQLLRDDFGERVAGIIERAINALPPQYLSYTGPRITMTAAGPALAPGTPTPRPLEFQIDHHLAPELVAQFRIDGVIRLNPLWRNPAILRMELLASGRALPDRTAIHRFVVTHEIGHAVAANPGYRAHYMDFLETFWFGDNGLRDDAAAQIVASYRRLPSADKRAFELSVLEGNQVLRRYPDLMAAYFRRNFPYEDFAESFAWVHAAPAARTQFRALKPKRHAWFLRHLP
jgi:hypothetical protein